MKIFPLGVSFFLLFISVLFTTCLAVDDVSSTTLAPTNDGIHRVEDFDAKEKEALEKSAVTYSFQAEVSRLLDTIINSLYTQKDVFLRELVSNAADGLEKARFVSVSQPKYLDKLPELEIRVSADKEAKTLTIQDTGVGMTKDELINNLGTVAQSGTTNFLEAISNGTDVNLIGQFGVGFYSAFLVANKVVVTSKSESDPKQHVWQSSATNSFTVSEDPRGPTLVRGTRVTLFLREDMLNFLEDMTLESTILKYNQYVSFPIFLLKSNSSDDSSPEDATKEDQNKTATVKREWDQINRMKPLWLRNRDDITHEEYVDFYKSLTHSFNDPIAYTHFVGEGEIEFRSIIYIPRDDQQGYGSFFSNKQSAIKLYARRVLVADSFYDLIPKWLSFMKGVVDSDDLPLKVDREALSQDRVLRLISRKIVAKFLDLIGKLDKEDKNIRHEHYELVKTAQEKGETPPPSYNETAYESFWNVYKKSLRIGCVEDTLNKDKISKLLRFSTSKMGPNEMVSLDEYVARTPESQKKIYYISNDDFAGAMSSPHLQFYIKNGIEVLILRDPVEEPCLDRIMFYEKKQIVSVEKANGVRELNEEEKVLQKRIQAAYKPLLSLWKDILKDNITSVRISLSLVDAPAAIVSPSLGYGAFGERVVRSQTFGRMQDMAVKQRILDINPHHPLIQELLTLTTESPDDSRIAQITKLVYETALLSSGFIINNPSFLSSEVFKLIQADLGLKKDAPLEEFVPPEDIVVDDSTSTEASPDIDMDEFQSLFDKQAEDALLNDTAEATPGSLDDKFDDKSDTDPSDYKDEL